MDQILAAVWYMVHQCVSACQNMRVILPDNLVHCPDIHVIHHHVVQTLSVQFWIMDLLNVLVCLATLKVQIQLEDVWKGLIHAILILAGMAHYVIEIGIHHVIVQILWLEIHTVLVQVRESFLF